ncbi:MAG: electron transfer flavoprotein subunit alpha/FixB family protein [Candidatus Brocadiia bacterium]
MADDRKVWVFAEVENGEIADVSLQLVSKATDLAEEIDGCVGAFLLGNEVEDLANDLFAHGCDDVLLCEDEQLAQYRTLPYTEVITGLISDCEPEIVLFGATPTGRDLAPRVASQLQVGLTADCTDLQIGPHRDAVKDKTYDQVLYQIRPAFGGNIIATIVSPETQPQMATVRPGVMHKNQPDPNAHGTPERIDVHISDESGVVKLLEKATAEKTVDLEGANIIVAGGAGVGSADNFELIEQLADTLGGEVGASRAAVDGGFIEKAHQVGQTGTTVRPKLYIACGISGAVQHRVGMQNAGKIVAINTDPDAPIFQIAHYGIVCDLNEVIPRLIEAYEENTK